MGSSAQAGAGDVSEGRGLQRRVGGLVRTGGLVGRGLELATSLGGGLELQSRRVVDLACGYDHVLAVCSDGSLWAWGGNASAQLGLPGTARADAPVLVEAGGWVAVSACEESSGGLKVDGTLWHWGAGPDPGPTDLPRFYQTVPGQVGERDDWASVCSGRDHTLGLTQDGSLWSWGSRNLRGGLGQSDLTWFPPASEAQREELRAANFAATKVGIANFGRVGCRFDWAAIAAGHHRSFALKDDGTLWSWGGGVYMPGSGRWPHSGAPPRGLSADRDWAALSPFHFNRAALRRDGSLWAWGSAGLTWARPDGSRTWYCPACIDDEHRWLAVAAGARHSVAVRSDGSLWAWGDNSAGQLGLGHADLVDELTRVGHESDWAMVRAGWSSSFAVKHDGSLWAWGSNERGLLSAYAESCRFLYDETCRSERVSPCTGS